MGKGQSISTASPALSNSIAKTSQILNTKSAKDIPSSLSSKPANIAFRESRCDSFPKLNKLLPQFNTNHRGKDGELINTHNEAPVSSFLDNVLTQLSPHKHVRATNWDIIEQVSDYRIEKTIGEGAHGKVKLAIHIPTGYAQMIDC
jgi:hypothetical protein